MPKMNQLIAVVDGVRKRSGERLTAAYHTLKKSELFQGMARTYRPIGSDPNTHEGEQLPPEIRNEQADVLELLKEIRTAQGEWIDVMLARDRGNTSAKATVQIGDKVIFENAPVSFLISLEKLLDDLHTELKHVPVLDPAERWSFDKAQNKYVTESLENARSRKLPRPVVKSPATKEHPAQVELVAEDVRVGTYTTRKSSTAMQKQEKDAILARLDQLQRAVKFAREHANEAPVDRYDGASKALYDFLFTT